MNLLTRKDRRETTRLLCCLLVVHALSHLARGQAPMQPQQGARAQQLPLSTREQGSVAAQQSAAPGAGASVSTVQSSVNISGRFQGSVSDPSAQGSISLSFAEAIQRGLRFNLGGVAAGNMQKQVRAQRLAAISQLLPSITGVLSQTVVQIYLPAEGISSTTFGGGAAAGGGGGLRVPASTGQFHYYTLQGSLNEDAIDIAAVRSLRSAAAAAAAADLSAKDARELIVLGVGGSYIQALSVAAMVEAQHVQVERADASYRQARTQHLAGTRARIDESRTLVELRTEQQRLTSDEAELAKQKIRLSRLIGVAPSASITLTSRLSENLPPPTPVEEAVSLGQSQRSDLKAAQLQVDAATQARRAASAEYLPTLSISGNYGLQGTSPDIGRVEYSGVASLNIPIFQSGRVRADTAQADAVLAERKAEYDDQRGQVEADVRTAYIDLDVSLKQVAVAKVNRSLAVETLTQSQDRFAAGAGDSVEVIQSQESLSAANRDYISSLYGETLAWLHLAQTTGQAETQFATLLEGAK